MATAPTYDTAASLTEAQLVAIRDKARSRVDFLVHYGPAFAERSAFGHVMDMHRRAHIENEKRWYSSVAFDAQAALDGCDQARDEVWDALTVCNDLHFTAFNLGKAA